jgi:DNA-binding IclR family transcriptional regulator
MKTKTPITQVGAPSSRLKPRKEIDGNLRLTSVERVFAILQDLTTARMTRREITEAALSRRDRIPKSTLSDLINMLTRLGYLRYWPDDKTYSLGMRFINLGEKAKDALLEAGPQKECRELLQYVVQETKVGAHIAILDKGLAIYIMREEAPDFFGAKIWEGRQQLPHLTAVGKALICRLSVEQIGEILKQHPDAINHKLGGVTKLKTLWAELAEIRERGWAYDDGEHHPEVRCVAAPIYSDTGEVVASIGVSRRKQDFDKDEMDRFGREYLRPAADKAAKNTRILSVLSRHHSLSNSPKRGRL